MPDFERAPSGIPKYCEYCVQYRRRGSCELGVKNAEGKLYHPQFTCPEWEEGKGSWKEHHDLVVKINNDYT